MLQIHYEPPFSAFKHRMVGRDRNRYYADDGLLAAANVALALGRPLLLTGEPGCGKTDFAFAAASALLGEGAAPEQYYVRSDTTARDLLYRYDTIRRFSDAQMTADPNASARARSPRNYIRLESLGRALVAD